MAPWMQRSTQCAPRFTRPPKGSTTTTVAILALSLLALLGVVLALVFSRRNQERPNAAATQPWAEAAGAEFAALTEAERCDLVFALAAVDDEPSRTILERALGDPSEAVCLAAARALAKLGRNGALERYFNAHPGERTRRVANALELFA